MCRKALEQCLRSNSSFYLFITPHVPNYPPCHRANVRALRCLVLTSLNRPRLDVLVDAYATQVRACEVIQHAT